MTTNTTAAVERVGDKVASKAVAPTTAARPATIYDVINRMRPQIERALPKHLDADRLLRIAITQVKQTPQLAECSQMSLLAAIMLSAQLGLEPGPLGHCWLIPRRIKGQWEVQWQLGYKGIIELARRSGQLVSIEAHDVREGDDFEFAYGLDPVLKHTFDLHSTRGEAYAYYGVAHFKDGGRYFLVMSRGEVEKRKARSSSASADFSPWKSDYDAMARKTVIRAMAPYLPLSAEILNGVNADETVRRDMTAPSEPDFIEGQVLEQDDDPPPADAPAGVVVQTGEVTPLALLARRYEGLTGKSKSLYNGERRDHNLPELDRADEWTDESLAAANALLDKITGQSAQPTLDADAAPSADA